MKKYTERIAALFFLGLLSCVIGCDEGGNLKSSSHSPAPSSVGREYGETLRGAINKANDVNARLEQAGETLKETSADREQ
ncbi:MAG: hypothetical protein AB7G75_27310 [Candidatus Binatia bacterium]